MAVIAMKSQKVLENLCWWTDVYASDVLKQIGKEQLGFGNTLPYTVLIFLPMILDPFCQCSLERSLNRSLKCSLAFARTHNPFKLHLFHSIDRMNLKQRIFKRSFKRSLRYIIPPPSCVVMLCFHFLLKIEN